MAFLDSLLSFVFYLVAWIVLLQVLARVATLTGSHEFEYWVGLAASFTALFICATYGTIASLALSAVGKGGLGQWTTARSFKWVMLLITGMWFTIDDPNDYLNTTRPAVFVGNHQTELDVLFLGHVFPKYCSVTAKKSLKYWPFLGWFSKYLRSCSHKAASIVLIVCQNQWPQARLFSSNARPGARHLQLSTMLSAR